VYDFAGSSDADNLFIEGKYPYVIIPLATLSSIREISVIRYSADFLELDVLVLTRPSTWDAFDLGLISTPDESAFLQIIQNTATSCGSVTGLLGSDVNCNEVSGDTVVIGRKLPAGHSFGDELEHF
jgi:hypothetical protein